MTGVSVSDSPQRSADSDRMGAETEAALNVTPAVALGPSATGANAWVKEQANYLLQDQLANLYERLICDNAPVWENQFDGGPGLVVSVKDAARVLARAIESAGRRS